MAHVLLVEPDRLLGRVYRQVLELAGHQVALVSQAGAALLAIEQQLPDLIILELQGAQHNGVELLYEIRSYTDWTGIPILLHTMIPPTHPGLGRGQWGALGIVDYAYKPQTNLAQLVARVKQLSTPIPL